MPPWGRLQRSVSCVNVVPSEYGTSVPKGMTCLSWGQAVFLYSAEIAPGYKFSFPDAEVLIEIAAAEHYCGE